MIGDVMQHVIIAGFGPVGRVLADVLVESGVSFTVIEVNAQTVNNQRALGRSVIHGDASDPSVLASAGIGDASALVITIPNPTIALRICKTARALAPTAVIAIRTRHLSEALQAKQSGADVTVVEEIETAKAMTTAVTAALKSGNQPSRTFGDDRVHAENRVRSAKSSRHARSCPLQPQISR
jgi:monovalent cation:H+ antiporter-2, CPA2 family